jgi:hypothetical protein
MDGLCSCTDKSRGSADNNVDESGMHHDVNVQSIVDSEDNNIPKRLNKSRPTADIDNFFAKIPDDEGHLQCLSCA